MKRLDVKVESTTVLIKARFTNLSESCVQLCTVVYSLYTTVHNCTQLSEVREAGFNEYGSAFDFYIPAVHPSCRNIHEQPCAS